MSVVVRMEMPKRCDLCDFWSVCKNVADFGKARYFEEPSELTVGMKGCKIVCQLPEWHGRLGDLDELGRKINGARIRAMQDGQDTNPYWECGDIIASEKTIVHAERSENDGRRLFRGQAFDAPKDKGGKGKRNEQDRRVLKTRKDVQG